MQRHVKESDISLILDGRQVEARLHEPLIQVARRAGVDIPSLCHHPALEAGGACRLCLVEVASEGRRALVASCTYPAQPGIEVVTSSEEILRHRRMILELLLARAPGAPVIRKLAADHGIEEPRFPLGDDTCILCGLCSRACEAYATSAIATMNRGGKKAIGTYAGEAPADCVGCGACADLCPTGHIRASRTAGKYLVWDREFRLATCGVDSSRCRGCGACDEACPFSIPRVRLRKRGVSVAEIDIQHCRGCGVCLAACPTGAIEQPRALRDLPSIKVGKVPRGVMVVACNRSNLKKARLPERARLLELPCSGGVSHAMLLGGLASGYDGVLVLGRHQSTCRLDGAEDHAASVVERVELLSRLLGLGTGRVEFVEPASGADGPLQEVERFVQKCASTPLVSRLEADQIADTLDGALDLLTWFSERRELTPCGEEWLSMHSLPAAEPGRPTLYAASIPYLDILLSEWLGRGRLGTLVAEGLGLLASLGIRAGVAVGGLRAGEDRVVARMAGSELFSLCSGCKERLENADARVTTLNDLLVSRGLGAVDPGPHQRVACDRTDPGLLQAAKALGIEIVEVDPAPGTGLRLAISGSERSALEQRLASAEAQGASAILTAGPVELVQHLMAQRMGAWRSTRVKPVLAAGLAPGGSRVTRMAV